MILYEWESSHDFRYKKPESKSVLLQRSLGQAPLILFYGIPEPADRLITFDSNSLFDLCGKENVTGVGEFLW